MADLPHSPTVRFAHTVFAVARPEVLPLLVEASSNERWMRAKFHGTAAELIAAGLATAELFGGVSAQKSCPDAYGNRYLVKRRGRGAWDLSIWTCVEPYYGDPTDPAMCKGKWWRENGAAVEAATTAILARFVRAYREAQP